MTASRTATFLMANLGSDLSQLFLHIEREERALAERAANRARVIIAELLENQELRSGAEEVRCIERLINDMLTERRLLIKKCDVEEYFLPFALRTLKNANVH